MYMVVIIHLEIVVSMILTVLLPDRNSMESQGKTNQQQEEHSYLVHIKIILKDVFLSPHQWFTFCLALLLISVPYVLVYSLFIAALIVCGGQLTSMCIINIRG